LFDWTANELRNTNINAKNMKLVDHYVEMLGATRVPSRIHEYRMEVFEEVAQSIIEKYTLEGDLSVK